MSLYNEINAYEQISSMYPRWYLDIYEMREIIRIESLIAKNMQKAIDLILDNHFLDTIDKNKASELESYLNISGISDRPIEERRAIIKSYFLGRGKISMSQIIAIVETLTGGKCTGNFTISDSANNHYIKLRIFDCDIKSMLIDIISVLSSRIPAHLWIELYYKPRRSEYLYKHMSSSATAVCSSIGTSGQWNDEVLSTTYINCVTKNSINNSAVSYFDMIYGGNLDSILSDEIFGGTLNQDILNDVINGGY